MEQTIIRGRRRGEVSPFSQLKTTGTITELPEVANYSLYHRGFMKGDMCPYTRFIPLQYLTVGLGKARLGALPETPDWKWVDRFYPGETAWAEDWDRVRKKINESPAKDLIWTGVNNRGGGNINPDSIKRGVEKWVDKYIKLDFPVHIDELAGYTYSTKEHVEQFFSDDTYFPQKFSFRTYRGLVSPYSIWTYSIENFQYQPNILPVIPIENWTYQKLHIILHGRPDINKMVVLVDNRVDGDFPYNAFKGFYRETLQPVLRKLPCPVLKVPHEYIMENCFVQDFQVNEKNIFERKKTVTRIIDGFYEKYGDVVKGE